jgi:hypothetical protein
MTSLLRTIRLDPSDSFVFERAAVPGEWAVSGAFAFWDGDPAALTGKARAAFRSGFLGVASLGRSTLVEIVEASATDYEAAVTDLARQLVVAYGAPDVTRAEAAAREEVAFAASLAEHPPGTLIAVHRTFEGGEIREAFRTLRRREGLRPVFAFDLDATSDDDASGETVDLASLARRP